MKTLIITGILFMLFLGCKTQEGNPKTVKPDYDIAINDTFQIGLASNRTTGYAWEWTNRRAVSIIEMFGYDYIVDNPVVLGSGGKEVWEFKGIKSGVDTLIFEYRRSWETNPAINTTKIVVQVK